PIFPPLGRGGARRSVTCVAVGPATAQVLSVLERERVAGVVGCDTSGLEGGLDLDVLHRAFSFPSYTVGSGKGFAPMTTGARQAWTASSSRRSAFTGCAARARRRLSSTASSDHGPGPAASRNMQDMICA